MKDIAKIILSREVIFFSVVIGAPLYIGAMLCMTLIPAICQAQKISAITLSYCYIANGLTGVYIRPALVSVALIVIVSSMILGFLLWLRTVS